MKGPSPTYEDGSPELPATSGPRHVQCEEDDDFLSAFDKMLNDSVAESRSAPRGGQQINIAAPVGVHRHKKAAAATAGAAGVPFGKH